MNTGAKAVISIVLGIGWGCGGGSQPPPESISVGDVTIESDPLVLRVATPRGSFVSEQFIEVGTVGFYDDGKYYDPRDLDDGVTWSAATRATGYDEESAALILDNGVRLSLAMTSDGPGATITVDASSVEKAVLLRVVMPRDPAEPVFGFGENFAAAEAGGSVREMQFRVDTESESALNEAHVPVPLALWPARGIGAFVRDERPGAFDVGAAREGSVLATYTLSVPGALDVLLFTDEQPLGLLRAYATLTSRPALPPKWSFAPQQWRNEHRNRQEVLDDAYRMRAEGIPGSTMWIDNPWQTAYNDFEFDETRFADPQGLLDELESLGYRVLVWSTPYVNRNGPTAPDFLEAREMGYLVTDDVGAPFVFPWQDGPGSLVDFSRPGATEWWRERIGRATARGISGFKLDFGEDVVPEFGGRLAPIHLAGGSAQTMHDRYSELYHEAYLGALPAGDGFLITRAGYWGEQRVNTCIWPGDLDSDFSRHGTDNGEGQRNVGGLPAAIAAMLSLSASGYPFFGSDIGGFREGPPTTEVLIRWTQYAALGTIMQLGGGGESHNPWDATRFDAPALDVYREYSRLHMDLVPYIYSLAVTASADGTPVTIPTRLVDYDAVSDDATFYLGDALFVAPVITAGATTRDVALPPGEWIDWWTGVATTGDGATVVTAAAPLETLPLWRRANAFVPMFARAADTIEPATAAGVTSYSDAAFGRELRWLITPTGEPAQRSVHDGASVSAASQGSDYSITLRAGSLFNIITVSLDRRASTVNSLTAPSAVTVGGVTLPAVVDVGALETCAAPGCHFEDTSADRLHVRVHLADTAEHVVTIAD